MFQFSGLLSLLEKLSTQFDRIIELLERMEARQ